MAADLEELDLTAYAQDAWTADADFFAQQVHPKPYTLHPTPYSLHVPRVQPTRSSSERVGRVDG